MVRRQSYQESSTAVFVKCRYFSVVRQDNRLADVQAKSCSLDVALSVIFGYKFLKQPRQDTFRDASPCIRNGEFEPLSNCPTFYLYSSLGAELDCISKNIGYYLCDPGPIGVNDKVCFRFWVIKGYGDVLV